MSRLLGALVLVAATLLGGCGAAPGACEVTIWDAGQTALEEHATIPPGLEQLVGPEDIDWSVSLLEAGNPPVLVLAFRPEAAARVADHTSSHVGLYLAIAMNGEVVSAPVIMSGIENDAMELEGTSPESLSPFAPCVGR